jgi:hypothetical protein
VGSADLHRAGGVAGPSRAVAIARGVVLAAVAVVLALPGCSRTLVDTTTTTVTVPAGAEPTTELEVPEVVVGQWNEWVGAELVLAWRDVIDFPSFEDDSHARLMAFADGRVLYRVREDDYWQWYVVTLDEEDVEGLRRAVAEDLAGTRSFACTHATHQSSTRLFVRTGLRWRTREVYGLWACLGDVERDAVRVYSQPDRPAPVVSPTHGFLRAYRRLAGFHEQHQAIAREWYTPRLSLVWSRDVDASEGKIGARWPEWLPSAPRLPRTETPDVRYEQPIDGAFGFALQLEIELQRQYEIDGEFWDVEIRREQPGDSTMTCVWNHPWRSCRRVRDVAADR